MEESQEKTEDATEKRKEELKKKGSIVRSKELTTTLILIAGTSSLLIFSNYSATHLLNLFSLWEGDLLHVELIHSLGTGFKQMLLIWSN